MTPPEICDATYTSRGTTWRCQSDAGHVHSKHFSVAEVDGELQDAEWKDSDTGAGRLGDQR